MNNSHYKALGVVFALASTLVTGCAAPVDSNDGDETIGEAEQEISCSNAGCTGLNPYATSCVLDQQAMSSGPITANGAQVGTITLYYSPTCHAIWGYAGLNGTHGNFKVCSTNITNLSQPPQCLSYGSTTFGAVSPMQFLRVGDVGYSNVLGLSSPLVSGSSSTFTRTF